MSKPRGKDYPLVTLSKLGPQSRMILETVYAADEPVLVETILTMVSPTIHPSVAHRRYVRELKHPRAKHGVGRGTPRADLDDGADAIRLGRRRILLSAIMNLERTGRLARTEVDGQKALVKGPKPLDFFPDLPRLFLVEWRQGEVSLAYVVSMTAGQARQLHDDVNAREDEDLAVNPIEVLSLWDMRTQVALEAESYT